MPTLLDFRRRIRSVKSTQQVTRAMKFVSAARLRRAQEKVIEARPYANAITEIVRSVAARMETPLHPLLVRRPERRVLLVIATGDRGLAGAFNANAVRRGMEFMRSQRDKEQEVLPMGRKGLAVFRSACVEDSGRVCGHHGEGGFSQGAGNRGKSDWRCMQKTRPMPCTCCSTNLRA